MNDAARGSRTAGLLLALAGVGILMGIVTAEALYPAVYTTAQNEISDLGATKPPNSVILQPSAAIFDVTMMVTGCLVAAAGALLLRSGARRFLAIGVVALGLGVLAVGVFPGNVGAVHQIAAMIAFIAGGLCGIAGWAAASGPLRWASGLLGAISLLVFGYVLFAGLDAPVVSDLGDGGSERWIAYPTIAWMVMFGGALMSVGSPMNQDGGRSQPVLSSGEARVSDGASDPVG